MAEPCRHRHQKVISRADGVRMQCCWDCRRVLGTVEDETTVTTWTVAGPDGEPLEVITMHEIVTPNHEDQK